MNDDDRIIKQGSFTELLVDDENDLLDIASGRYQIDRNFPLSSLFRGESDAAYLGDLAEVSNKLFAINEETVTGWFLVVVDHTVHRIRSLHPKLDSCGDYVPRGA